MPFPWKKVKSARISRLLNDHLHNSQKRRDGSSLVVETGFPTSLIDLFIKNREKLKNSSNKKPQTSLSLPSQNDPVITAGSPTLFPSPMQPQVIAGPPLNCSSPLRKSVSLLHLPLGVNEIDVGDGDGGGTESKCGVQRAVNANGVILVAVKIFLVAVSALGAKRLTVGITMSAFFLCFLEYAAKHLRELLKPCSKARWWLLSVVQKVPKLRYKDGASLWKVRQEGFPRPDPSVNSWDSVHQTQMIEIEKPNHYPIILTDEIQSEKEIMEDSFFVGRYINQEPQSNGVVIEKEKSLFGVAKLRRKSRKDKIQSKMKLFLPKKFWSLRKDHNFRRLEVIQEDKVAVCEEQGMDEWESETSSRLSSTSSGKFKEDVMNSIVGGLPEIDEEVATNKETKSRISWSNFVPCLTVLIGLIGGRPVALLLTLSWFLVLKFGEALPRYREVPMIKSFDDQLEILPNNRALDDYHK